MKCFDDTFTPIEVTVKTVEGEEHVLKSRFVTSEDYKELLQLSKDLTDDPTKSVDYMYKSLILIFGKDQEFYQKFSLSLLAELSKYGVEQTRAKTNVKKKKKY